MTEVQKPVDQLSLTELATEYNRLAEEIEANSTGLKPVKVKRIKGFKDRTTGIRRIGILLNGGEPEAAPKEAAPKEAAPKAKKPLAKPKAKPAPKAKEKKSAREYTNSIGKEFGFKAGGERDRLLQCLSAKMGRQVKREELGELAPFVSKLTLRIQRKRLPYKLTKEKKDDEAGYSYGLYRK